MKQLFQNNVSDDSGILIGVKSLTKIEKEKRAVLYDTSIINRPSLVFGKLGEGKGVRLHV